MVDRICRALLFWLTLFELLAGWRGWWGLTWLGRAFPRRLLPFAALLAIRGGWRRRGVGLALLAPLALLIQVAASSWRQRELNPLLRLRPGSYDDRLITRLDIAMPDGQLPALHIVPRRRAAAICVLHGSGCDKTSYAWRLVDTLVEQGLAVLLIDLDGHGENPRPQSFPAILADVGAAISWLRERYERVGLIGISLGGCIAARAIADGVMVDALAVLEAPPLLHYTRADVCREGLALAQPRLLGVFSDCTVYHLFRAWTSAPIRATISTWQLIAALDLPGSLPRITAPLLLLYGARDAIVKPAQAEQARRAAPPGTTFRLVRGASHLTLILTPEALRLVGDWFALVLRAADPAEPFF
jgi:alpha-beta hydrolase superfamily lysophospholipase